MPNLAWATKQTGRLPGHDPTCRITGCDKPRGRRRWCSMHYTRYLRHGDPLAFAHDGRDGRGSQNINGYRMLSKRAHPLADSHGEVYEHRLVLYEVIGPGVHGCRWCGRPVAWGINLYVDHVDDDPVNNTPTNLVPSCNGCNINRPKLPGTSRRPRTLAARIRPSTTDLQEADQ